jgi:hypothetical protein
MSLAFKIKTGVAIPAFSGQLLHGTTPVNLTTATSVTLYWRKIDKSEAAHTGVMTLPDATLGKVKYTWVANDVTSGKYRADIKVIWPGAQEERFPNDEYVEFDVLEVAEA